ncbi:MAG: phage tail tape measure protein [Phototrophicales bacterium]|nr:MAG: phage tail tape measure protein [Phototrophicales bacterium]
MSENTLRFNVEAKYRGRGFEAAQRAAREFEDGLISLSRELQQQAAAWKEANSRTIALKTSYKQLQREGFTPASETLQDLSRQINEAQEAEHVLISETRRLIQANEEAAQGNDRAAASLAELGGRLDYAEAKITGLTRAQKNANQNAKELTKATDRVGDEMAQVGQQTQRAADGIDRVGDESKRAADGIDSLNSNLAKIGIAANVVGDMLTDAAYAAVQFAKDSNQAFLDFDRSSREIFTLLPEASVQMRESLTRDVQLLGTELGRLPEEMLPAVYQALSAGIPKNNVLDSVETASSAARAGVAELSETLATGVGILNAYGRPATELENVYDSLFFLIKNGVITMRDLNATMSQVTSVAGEANVPIEDITAALAVMTKQGDSAGEATELLSLLITQLATDGTQQANAFAEAAGQSFRSYMEHGGSLAGALETLQAHAEKTNVSLGTMLSGGSPFFRDTQAARAAMELTGVHMQEFADLTKEAGQVSGTMAVAAAEMGEAAEMSSLRAKAAMEEFKIELGETLNQGMIPLYENATEFLTILSGNKAGQIDAINESMIAAASNSQELADAGKNIADAYDIATGSMIGVIGTGKEVRQELTAGAEETIRALAQQAGSLEEFRTLLADMGTMGAESGTFALLAGFEFNPEEIFKQAQLDSVNNTLQETDQRMIALGNTMAQIAAPELPDPNLLSQIAINALDVSSAFTYGDEAIGAGLTDAAQLARDTADELIATSEAIATVSEERAARIAAAAQAEQAAIMENRQAYGSYVNAALSSTETETNWIDVLFQSANAEGISQAQRLALMAATGEYDEAAQKAILTQAAMKIASEELATAIANGEITVSDAVTALNDFQTALEDNYTVEFNYDDLINGTNQAATMKAALLDAAGEYKATFTTTYETIHKDTGTKGGATALSTGGTFQPGEWLIVGDGPGGQILPTTELVVFDRPGTVFNGAETNRMFNNAAAGTPAQAGIHIDNISIIMPNGSTPEMAAAAKDGTIQALREAGLTL